MLSNSQVKHINALKIKKYREEYREFIAEGNTLVTDLINSAYEISGVYALSIWITSSLDLIRNKNLTVFEAEPGDMEKITFLSSPSPVLAIVKIPPDAGEIPEDGGLMDIERIIPGIFDDLSLMLEGISDPGNLGTLLRIADWCVELFNPKVVQASMGSVARVRVFYTGLANLLEKLKGSLPVYGTFLVGDPVYSRKLSSKGIILIGSEAHGISNGLSDFVTHRLFIPSFGSSGNGKAESLNAAVATAVIIYEFRRPVNFQ
jgi:TrmH family RNA methyltransferase